MFFNKILYKIISQIIVFFRNLNACRTSLMNMHVRSYLPVAKKFSG